MALTKSELRNLYAKRAENYDLSANAYYLIGFREFSFRKDAVSALRLKKGDRVVEVGCGTGLNFRYLLEAVGESGELFGVDLTEAMLEKAKERVRLDEWRNVHVIQGDAADYVLPRGVNGVISTFALTLVPEYEVVIRRTMDALAPRGRLVIGDFKKPEWCPVWLAKLGVLITRPFGVSLDLAERKPWEVMRNYFPRVAVTEYFGGFVYIAVGEKA